MPTVQINSILSVSVNDDLVEAWVRSLPRCPECLMPCTVVVGVAPPVPAPLLPGRVNKKRLRCDPLEWTIELDDVSKTGHEWLKDPVAIAGSLTAPILARRLKSSWTAREALTIPVGGRRSRKVPKPPPAPRWLRCVSCGSDAELTPEREKATKGVSRSWKRRGLEPRHMRNFLRGCVDRDVSQARALFEAAGKPLPQWLQPAASAAAAR